MHILMHFSVHFHFLLPRHPTTPRHCHCLPTNAPVSVSLTLSAFTRLPSHYGVAERPPSAPQAHLHLNQPAHPTSAHCVIRPTPCSSRVTPPRVQSTCPHKILIPKPNQVPQQTSHRTVVPCISHPTTDTNRKRTCIYWEHYSFRREVRFT